MRATADACACGLQAALLGRCDACFAAFVQSVRAATRISASGLAFATGQRVGAGRFTLLEELGSGGMGAVWLATDEHLSADDTLVHVALKFITAEGASDPETIALLRKEVRASLRVSHPSIVRVHSWHEHPGEAVFYSMEFVPGVDLRRLLEAHPAGWFAERELEPVVAQLVNALVYAHENVDLVHRDLKPANILIGEDRQVRLADFGLARPDAGADVLATTAGGTPLYASPQQRSGLAPCVADDVYSLGATLYHLLVGRPPYSPEQLAAGSTWEPPLHPWRANPACRKQVSAEVGATLLRCLSVDPSDRPPDVRTFWKWWSSGPPDLAEQHAHARQRAVVIAKFVAGLLLALGLLALVRQPSFQTWAKKVLATRPSVTPTDSQGMAMPPIPAEPKATEPTAVQAYPLQLETFAAPPGPLVWLIRADSASGHWVASNTTGPTDRSFSNSLPAGRYWIDVGVQPLDCSRWVRLRLDHKDGDEIHRIDFTPPRTGFGIVLSHAVPVTLVDAWNQTVARFGITDFHPVSQKVKGEHLEIPSTMVLRPGRYFLRLPRLTTERHGIEPSEDIPVDIPPGANEYQYFALAPWRTPRIKVIWTNSLGVVLLPFHAGHDFLAARTETSVGQFAAFADATGLPEHPLQSVTPRGFELIGRTWRTAFPEQTADHPVVGVSWDDARRFCAWLTTREIAAGRLATNQFYALPTATEWTAVAGTNTYPWGMEWPPPPGVANLAGKELAGKDWPAEWNEVLFDGSDADAVHTARTGRAQTPPGQAMDVAGNAAEWCESPFDPDLNTDPDVKTIARLKRDGAGPARRVVRGGSWFDTHERILRTTTHWAEDPGTRNDRIGFRMVLREH